MRLPPRPDLTWKEDGTPVDERVGDVYYSVADGLAESEAVFLAGCDLPRAWQGRTNFTVAELGFGTGLNFLATWRMWRRHGTADGWLHFVSFEGYPLDQEDVARALKPWPELNDLAAQLCAKWPVRAKGVRQITWPEDRITLTLHIGLIEETLPAASLQADAWYLDGFSPAKNQAMWDEKLWPLLAARTRPGARAATFTVAGAVRRGLSEAGFAIEKKPGYGRKRERLEAIYSGPSAPVSDTNPGRIAIIGAGISGACLARALTRRGANVTVFDRAEGPALGTSGNPMALVMPRLDAADTVQARLLIDAYLTAQTEYRGLPGVSSTEIVHDPRDDKEAARFQKLLADPPLGLEHLEAIRNGGLLHKAAMILHPAKLIPALLDEVEVQWDQSVEIDISARTVDGQVFDQIILANGWGISESLPQLEIIARLGQVEWYESSISAPPNAVVKSHYALADQGLRLWGATFEDHPGGPPNPTVSAREENAQALGALSPYWVQDARKASIHSRAGVRAATADQLPLIGPLPDLAALADAREQLSRQNWRADLNAFIVPGIHIAGGYGSRGFTWGPWAANLITAQLFGDPAPVAIDALHSVVPNRQPIRRLKRA